MIFQPPDVRIQLNVSGGEKEINCVIRGGPGRKSNGEKLGYQQLQQGAEIRLYI